MSASYGFVTLLNVLYRDAVGKRQWCSACCGNAWFDGSLAPGIKSSGIAAAIWARTMSRFFIGSASLSCSPCTSLAFNLVLDFVLKSVNVDGNTQLSPATITRTRSEPNCCSCEWKICDLYWKYNIWYNTSSRNSCRISCRSCSTYICIKSSFWSRHISSICETYWLNCCECLSSIILSWRSRNCFSQCYFTSIFTSTWQLIF